MVTEGLSRNVMRSDLHVKEMAPRVVCEMDWKIPASTDMVDLEQ